VAIQQKQKPLPDKFKDLPSPPAILVELIDTCNSPSLGFERLAETIQKDASVTSQIMAAANSPIYRQWKSFSSLQHLLVTLGISSVRTIAINSAVQQYFSKLGKQQSRTLDLIWYQSLVCAQIARSLAELTAYPHPEEAYLAGLLHRLGQLVLLQSEQQTYLSILEQNLGIPEQLLAEQDAFGITSPQLGAQMIESWELKPHLSDALLYQNEPAEKIFDNSPLVKLINLSSQLADASALSDDSVLAQADALFGLNQLVVEKIRSEAHDKAMDAAHSLGIALPTEEVNMQQVERHHEALGERVKQAALFGGSLEAAPKNSDLFTILQHIQKDLCLLFGIKPVCFLLKQTDSPELHPLCPTSTNEEELQDLVFSTESDSSLAALVFNHQIALFTQEKAYVDKLSMVDQQLSHYLNSDGLIYLPLSAQQSLMGVIALGLSSHQWQSLSKQIPLLILFAREASKMLIHQRELLSSHQQLLENERAAFYLKARKVVHEASNPLGIINNYLYILGMKLGKEHPVTEELDILKEEITRVGKILLRIRDIPEELEQQEKGTDINHLIKDIYKLFQASLFTTHNISTEIDLDPNIPLITTQRGHLKQILTNLIKNAVEAMPKGGNLRITSSDNAYLDGKMYVEILIIDSGPGIDRKIMDQLFSPVESTKGNSHSGLGLAIVKNLIDELSGVINCTSNRKMGTRFQLLLPRTN
jgi:signal transduction histidine kinase/HD-like signal output (HDOD) protein